MGDEGLRWTFLSIHFLLAFFLISKAKMGRVGFGSAYSILSSDG